MKFLKKYNKFVESIDKLNIDSNETELNEIEVAAPERRTTTQPGIKPGTKPGTKPRRPSPIRRDKPGVKPAPKAELPTATIEDVIEKYAKLTDQKY